MAAVEMEPNIPMVVLYDYQLAAIVVLIVSLIGASANGIVAFFTRKLPTMNNPFGRLTASQAVAETILCAVFVFYFAPMMIFDSQQMIQYSLHAGFINLVCYDICIWSHLFISLNRLVAIVYPLHYDQIFSKKNTMICIVISWIIPIITAVVLYKFHICDFFYSPQFWAFVFTISDTCNFISWNIDFYKDLSIVIIIGVVDLFTIFNVHRTAHAMAIGSHMQRMRRKKEINFLKQACLQGVVFVFELFTYFYFAWTFKSRWTIFALTTFAWIMVHTLDGIIIICFNREFRKLVTTPFKKMYVSGHSTSLPPIEHPGCGSGVAVLPISQELSTGLR